MRSGCASEGPECNLPGLLAYHNPTDPRGKEADIWACLGGSGGKDDKDEGKMDRAKGRMKEAGGALTGEKGKKREGRSDQRKGKAKEKKGDLKDLLS